MSPGSKSRGHLSASDECCGEIDVGPEAVIGLVISGCNTPRFLDFGAVVFDEVAPFVHLGVIVDLGFAVLAWRDDRLCLAPRHVRTQPVGVKGLVGEQSVKCQPLDQRPDAHDVVALPRHQDEAPQIAQRIDQSRDLGRQPAFRSPNGLSLSPPLAPVAFW